MRVLHFSNAFFQTTTIVQGYTGGGIFLLEALIFVPHLSPPVRAEFTLFIVRRVQPYLSLANGANVEVWYSRAFRLRFAFNCIFVQLFHPTGIRTHRFATRGFEGTGATGSNGVVVVYVLVGHSLTATYFTRGHRRYLTKALLGRTIPCVNNRARLVVDRLQ